MSKPTTGSDGVSRRAIISVIAASAGVVAMPQRANFRDQAEEAAAALARAMEGMHGGTWIVNVDHDRRVAVIVEV